MWKMVGTVLGVFATFALSTIAHGEPSSKSVTAFFAAYEQARQPDAKSDDLEAFLAFLADDLTDHHHAYARVFEGKAHLRNGIRQKSQSMVSLSQEIEQLVIGTSVAVAVVNEDSRYYKDDELKRFQGRTIFVLIFDQSGLITEMRRYLD